jgi:uncharacterized protein
MNDVPDWEDGWTMSDFAASAGRIGGLVLIAYVALCLLVYFKQASYVYYPDKSVGLTPAYFKLAFENLKLRTVDGETITGWFVPAQSYKAVIICHGNAGNIANRLDLIVMFHNIGLNVLIFDYRGYGDSTGKPTEQGTYRDAKSAWDWLVKTKEFKSRNVAIYGESLGGAVAAWMAEQVHPGALMLDSTFTSAPDMAKKMFPFLPIRWLCKFKYDTLGAVAKAGCPVLVAHSKNDEMIPYLNGLRIMEAAKQPKQFIEMTGQHNDGGILTDARHLQTVDAFLSKYLGQSGKGG